MSTPQVSVIIPVYNGARFLEASVGSVIAQTLSPLELFCVDDGSTDGSPQMLEAIETPFPKHILYQKRKRQSAACNMAAAQARGKYLAFIDQDDIWYPRALEMLVAPLEQNALLGWSYSDVDEIDSEGFLVARNAIRTFNALAEHPKTSLFNMLGADMFVLASSAIVRRDAFMAIGGFDERLSGYEDDDLFIRLFNAGWMNVFLQESQVRYRRHSGSSTHSERMRLSREIFASKLIEMFPDEPQLDRFYVRDLIAPRFFAAAKAEYANHFPTRNWEQCQSALELMRRFAALMGLPFGRNGPRRAIIFRLLACPRILNLLYPLVRPQRLLARL